MDDDPLRTFVRHGLDAQAAVDDELRKANIALAKDDAQQAYDLFTHMSTDHLQLLLQAHRLDAHAMTRPASIIFSAGRQALIRARPQDARTAATRP
jgi:hypothetical protein